MRTRLVVALTSACALACGGLGTGAGPLQGELDGSIVFGSGKGAADADRIEQRLNALGCPATRESFDAGTLEVSVSGCADLGRAAALAIRPARLVLVTEAGEQVPLSPPTDVEVVRDDWGESLRLTLTPEDGATFGALTAAHIDEVLTVKLDDEVLMAPVVREAIDGGTLQITLGETPLDPTLPVLLGTPGPQTEWAVFRVSL